MATDLLEAVETLAKFQASIAKLGMDGKLNNS